MNGKHTCFKEGHVSFLYEYQLTIDCSRSKYDSSSFIVDHNNIDNAVKLFANRVSSPASCELIVAFINRSVLRELNSWNSHLQILESKLMIKALHPQVSAWMTDVISS